MNIIAKSLIFFGAMLVFIGIIFSLSGKIPWLGRLPGDIIVKKENFSFYFPVTTSILASIILSFILFLFTKR